MSSNVISVIIEAAIYIVLVSGIVLIFYEKRYKYIEWYKMRKRLHSGSRRKSERAKYFMRSDEMMQVLFKNNIGSRHLFFTAFVLAAAVFAAGIGTLRLPVAIAVSVFASLLPYLLLCLRFEGVRRRGSFEGELLVSSLLSSYRINNFNMIEAIEQLVVNNKDLRFTLLPLYRMVPEIRSADSDEKIEAAADKFAFSIDTNWSRMLAMNIKLACIKGTNMSLAIEEILKQLREAKSLEEERKRLNSESVRMTVFMVPLTYLGTILAAVKYINIPAEKLVENQVGNAHGLMMFFMIVLMFVMNLALIEVVANRKFDF